LKIAITGASGFIGSNLVRHFAEAGHDVVALLRSPAKAAAMDRPRVTVAVGDVVDRDSLVAAFSRMDAVVHVAALFNNPEASRDEYLRVNLGGTKNVLEAALRQGVSRVLHCSTIGVAAGHGDPPYSESTPYSPPAWDKYEVSKCEGEKAAIAFFRSRGLPVVVLRPAQVYGPGDRSKAKFYRMIRKGVVVNPGTTMKHMIYVDDLCRAFGLALQKRDIEGEVFIIAGKEPTHLRELIEIAAKGLGVATPRIRLPALPITILFALVETAFHSVRLKPPVFRRSMDFFTKSVSFDVHKAKELLGFQSEIDVPTGVARTIAWYRENGLLG
jgi:nucleoside-diphosphate-sugar epimerase